MILAIALALMSAEDRAPEVSAAPVVVVRDTAWFSERASKVSLAVPEKEADFIAKDWKVLEQKKPDDFLLPCTPCEVTR
jgi:hypothetical protein